MAAYRGGMERVYVDVATDSVCFPTTSLLWFWQTKGEHNEVRRVASGGRVFVSSVQRLQRRNFRNINILYHNHLLYDDDYPYYESF